MSTASIRFPLLLGLLLGALAPEPAAAVQRAVERKQFLVAYAQARRGTPWELAASGLKSYPLWPYLVYAGLNRGLEQAGRAPVQRFLADHADTPLAPRLRQQALAAWAKAGRWPDFLALYPADSEDTTLRCHAWTARHHGAPQQVEALRAAAVLWRATPRVVPACGPAFAALEGSGQLGSAQRLARIEAAFEAGDLQLVAFLLPKLPDADRTWPARRLLLRQRGLAGLATALQWGDGPEAREAVAATIATAGARDPRGAEVWRLKATARLAFTAEQQLQMQRAIAYGAAVDDLAEADGWLRRIEVADYAEPRLYEWATRYRLGRGQLDQALAVLAAMPADPGAQPRWRYLHGRVLELRGQAAAARTQYARIAGDSGFYPFLAADRIGADYALCEAPFAPDPALQSRLQASGAWQRALELRATGFPEAAASELQLLAAGLDVAGRVQLAELLVGEGWYESSIRLLAAPEYQRHYRQRFPRPWGRAIDRNAAAQRLDPNWTSGLIRAESAFNRHARSSADARGLMQLLPGTARQLAGGKSTPDLYAPAVNLNLGARYLRLQFDKFGGDPLATTAAYNAGPGAVARWLPKASRQWPDLWVETIPYFETREYVARVMSFSTVYDWRDDGRIRRLGARLGLLPDTPVAARCPAATTSPSTPAATAPG